jgi:hypothetical protein
MDPRVKPAGDGEGWQPVIAGLDPAIHRLTKMLLKNDGPAGQARG